MPPKEPDFETPDIERIVEGVVAKYALRLFVAGLVGAFGFGCWLTRLTYQISDFDKRPDVAAKHEWFLTDHEKRISKLEAK